MVVIFRVFYGGHLSCVLWIVSCGFCTIVRYPVDGTGWVCTYFLYRRKIRG
jgi:hypothetical protein